MIGCVSFSVETEEFDGLAPPAEREDETLAAISSTGYQPKLLKD